MVQLKKNVFISLSGVGALLLFGSGCSVGPDFVPPKVEVADRFLVDKHVGGVGEATSALYQKSEPSPTWWTGFKDDTLERLVLDVAPSNRSLATAYARLMQAQGVYREGQTGLYPTLGLSAGYRDSKTSQAGFQGPNSGSREQKLYSAGISALWELDFFGRIRREIEGREAEQAAAAEELADMQRIMVSEATGSYIELRGAQQRLAILKKNAELQKRTVELTQKQLDAGKVTRLDLMRATTQLHLTLSAIPSVENNIRSIALGIGVLAGKEPQELVPSLEVGGNLPQYVGPVAIGDPAAVIRNRPDIAAAESKLHAATARIGFAIGDMFPKVEFTGNLGLEGLSPRDFHQTGAENYLIAPRITWRAFEFGRLRERVDVAKATTAEALANFEQKVLMALQEVESSLSSYARERERRADLQMAFAASKEAFELAQMQYSNGAIDLLALIDTQRQLLAAEESLVGSETKALSALVQVFRSLGGRWSVG